MGRFPAELEGRTRYRVSVHLPGWLHWMRRLVPQIEVTEDMGLEAEDIREMETIAAIEAEEAERTAQQSGMNGGFIDG